MKCENLSDVTSVSNSTFRLEFDLHDISCVFLTLFTTLNFLYIFSADKSDENDHMIALDVF